MMCSLEWRDVELAIGGRVPDEIGKMQPILKTPGNDLFGLIRQGCDEVATILTSRSMQIKELIPFEPVWVNTDLLNGLGERLGFEDAEILVNAAMEELAELLYLTESLLGDSDSKRLRETCSGFQIFLKVSECMCWHKSRGTWPGCVIRMTNTPCPPPWRECGGSVNAR